ncbi:NADH-quinone oxidoreductase subunit K [Acuticoccus yangtzensis]|uniref:NADH-quinone oxidoreductase subunit K n=1 Tax=Acuticoccus yangtzensis TaxID=1443441 RepID=UPI0009499E37|nr:NADH-quinone oxidoreductase subunit K [Acuticoccus yangtzensis]
MEAIFSLVVGLFFAASIYLMLSSHLVRILLGVSIFGNAVNLMIFTAGRLGGPAPPVLAEGTHHSVYPEGAASAPIGHTGEGLVPGPEGAAPAHGGTLAGADMAVAPGADAAVPSVGIEPTGAVSDQMSSLAGAASSASDILGATANPLPQALILTAIVISFSIFAFLLVLTFRAYQSMDTDNVDDMRVAEVEPVRPPLGY